jgi:hypothetical protein
MALRTLFLRADHIDTPLEEGIETFIVVLFVIQYFWKSVSTPYSFICSPNPIPWGQIESGRRDLFC